MAIKTAAFGTILTYGDGGSPTEIFTKIASVKDLDGPSLSRDTIDVTSHDSVSKYREFLAGLKDGGEVTFDIEFDPSDTTHAGTNGLMKMFEDDEPVHFQLITTVAATTGYWGFTFSALVTGFEPSMPVEDSLKASVTLKITGPVAGPTDLTLPA